jgi:hypothetical protein
MVKLLDVGKGDAQVAKNYRSRHAHTQCNSNADSLRELHPGGLDRARAVSASTQRIASGEKQQTPVRSIMSQPSCGHRCCYA